MYTGNYSIIEVKHRESNSGKKYAPWASRIRIEILENIVLYYVTYISKKSISDRPITIMRQSPQSRIP